jgi:hypothetical protein
MRRWLGGYGCKTRAWELIVVPLIALIETMVILLGLGR